MAGVSTHGSEPRFARQFRMEMKASRKDGLCPLGRGICRSFEGSPCRPTGWAYIVGKKSVNESEKEKLRKATDHLIANRRKSKYGRAFTGNLSAGTIAVKWTNDS